MKAASVLALAGFVAAQHSDISFGPACPSECFESEAPKVGCSLDDLACLCRSLPKILDETDFRGCVAKCTQEERDESREKGRDMCNALTSNATSTTSMFMTGSPVSTPASSVTVVNSAALPAAGIFVALAAVVFAL